MLRQLMSRTATWYRTKTVLSLWNDYVVPGLLSLAHPLSHVSLSLSSPAILSVPLFPPFPANFFCRKDSIVEIVAQTEKHVYLA